MLRLNYVQHHWTVHWMAEAVAHQQHWTAMGHQVDHLLNLWRSGICWWPSTSLTISQKKTEVMMLASHCEQRRPSNNQRIHILGCTVRHDGGAGSNIRDGFNKAKNTLRMLNNKWRSSQYSTKTKLRLYQSCILFTLLNAGEWLKESLTNCPPYTPRTLEESCKYCSLRPSLTNIFSPAVTKTAWAPWSCKGDGDGWGMWWEQNQATSPTQPFTGHHRGIVSSSN